MIGHNKAFHSTSKMKVVHSTRMIHRSLTCTNLSSSSRVNNSGGHGTCLLHECSSHFSVSKHNVMFEQYQNSAAIFKVSWRDQYHVSQMNVWAPMAMALFEFHPSRSDMNSWHSYKSVHTCAHTHTHTHTHTHKHTHTLDTVHVQIKHSSSFSPKCSHSKYHGI